MTSKHIAITGIGGMVGSYLSKQFSDIGYVVNGIPRGLLNNPDELQKIFSTTDIVINLAGENISEGRWTKERKDRIYNSRVNTTKVIVDAMNSCSNPPELLISASGIGYYGTDCGHICSEEFPPGNDFLAKVCMEWERQALRYKKGRVAISRFGIVMSNDGGFLQKMYSLRRWGLLSKIGNGYQNISWIAIEDIVDIYKLIIDHQDLAGPINVVTDKPISNEDLSSALNKGHFHIPFISIPKFIIRLIFGEMGKCLILSNQSVNPKKLLEYNYKYTELNL